jgi:hypothetical protein
LVGRRAEVVSVAVEAVEGAVGLLAGVASTATLEELEAVGGSLVGEAVVGSLFPVVVVAVVVVMMAWGLASPITEFALKIRMYRSRLRSI